MLPFARFAGADSVLGPEMKSTGEVMGIAADFPTAFGKAQAAAGVALPAEGTVFITVTDTDKPAATQLAARFHDLGFEVIATGGTAQAISRMGVPVTRINKIGEGSPNVVDLIRERRCDLVINTPTGSGARADGYEIRTAAVRHGIPCVTTMTGATAAARAIAARAAGEAEVRVPPGDPRHNQDRCSLDERAAAAGGCCEVTANRASGGYRVFSLLDRDGPGAGGRASSTCSPREDGWGEGGGRPFLPRALSVADAAPDGDGVRLDFLVEGVGPGTDRLCALEPGERVWVNGPLGNAFSEPRELAPGRRRGDPGRRRDRGRAAGAAAPALLGARDVPAQILLGFRDQRTRGGLDDLFSNCQMRLASDDGHLGERGYVTDLLAAMLAGDDAARPPSTPAARRRCSRRCGRSAPSAGSPASWRSSRRWPAASAPASAARCRWPAGGYMRLCVDGPVVAAEIGSRR